MSKVTSERITLQMEQKHDDCVSSPEKLIIMEPLMHLSPLALAVATLAFFVFGFLWYTPLFGKVWAKEMGFERDKMNVTTGFMVRSLILNFLGNFLLVFVLAHNTHKLGMHALGVMKLTL